MFELLSKIENITGQELLGLILFFFGAATIITVQAIFHKRIITGLEGDNLKFEMPEVIIYIFSYVIPFESLASVFMPTIVKIDISGWLFNGGVIAFALAGRYGLNWILALKTNQTTVPPTNDETLNKQ